MIDKRTFKIEKEKLHFFMHGHKHMLAIFLPYQLIQHLKKYEQRYRAQLKYIRNVTSILLIQHFKVIPIPRLD